MNIKVYYEDTDAQGVVYHANYLKYFDRARTEWLMRQTMHWQAMCETGYAYVVKSVQVNYHAPAKLGDDLTIHSQLSLSRPTVALWHQIIFRNDERICEANIEIVYVNAQGHPQRLPEYIKACTV